MEHGRFTERAPICPPERVDAAQSLYDHGVRFTCEVKIASIIFQYLYRCFSNMQRDNPDEQALATELMLDGIIDKIVID